MMDRETGGIQRRLIDQWNFVRTELRRLHHVAEVRPDDVNVFRPLDEQTPNAAFFELRPVVFNLPERATHASNDLFIVVQGRLSFQRQAFRDERRLLTDSFATEAGYFRRTGHALDHVFGAHYDFAAHEAGHPAFHAQFRSFAELADQIRQQYHIDLPVNDVVRGVLKTVRIPTAQMDVFSLFVQVCADHLLHNGSSDAELEAFDSLLSKSNFSQGAGYQIPRLGTEDARHCYRARHWYPALG
jgi:hypothetical protein